MLATDFFTFGIDGNWFAFSRWQSCCRDFKLTFMPDTFERDRRKFIEFLTTSFCYEQRLLTNVIDSTIIVTDLKSWRKSYTYLVNPFDEVSEDEVKYKGNREYDEEVDFNKLFEVFIEWVRTIRSEYGIVWLQASGAEGDDMLAILSKRLNLFYKKNFLFLSTDKDMIQLNRYHKETGAITVYYRKRVSGFGATRKQENVLTTDIPVLEQIKCRAKQTEQSVDVLGSSLDYLKQSAGNPYKALLEVAEDIEIDNIGSAITYKILLGDGGDNVGYIIAKDSSTGKRNHFKAGHKHICESLDQMSLKHDDLELDMIYDDVYINNMLLNVYKSLYKSKHNPEPTIEKDLFDWYKAKWVENRKLMFLDDREIPAEVVSEIDAAISRHEHEMNRLITDACSTIPGRDEVLQLFSMISSDSAMKMYETELMQSNQSPAISAPIQPASPTIGTTTQIEDTTESIDDIVSKAMQG